MNYAVVTPTRDEAENLPRLAAALAAQTVLPTAWVIVDNGSQDATVEIGERLAEEHPWVQLLAIGAVTPADRGLPIVRALHAGFTSLEPWPDIVASVDADVSFAPDFFERLLGEFASDPALGIASGSALELERGRWRQRFVTGTTVWGATRLWRRACLRDVLPLEPRLGWDGIDEFKANASGWRTRTVREIHFHHYRPEGSRDATRWRARYAQGQLSHYVGYRWWYLVLRAAFNAARGPSAFGLVHGYLAAVLERAPRTSDQRVRAYVRSQQRLRRLPDRAREALGR